MNTTALYYDELAASYNMADNFGSISLSHEAAIEQIQQKQIGHANTQLRVLDMGVGDAAFLKKLHHLYPEAELYGFDISKEMLKKAKQNLDFHAIEGSAADADKLLPLHLQDLVLAHFINAYIPTETIFRQAKLMLKADGYFSFITSTYESFPESQTQIANFVAKDSLLGGLVGHYYKSVVTKTPVASGKEEIFHHLKQFDFEIISHQRLTIPIYFHTIEDMEKFGIDGSWFLNSFSGTSIPKQFFIERLIRFAGKIFTFPYHDEHIIDILLVKK